MDLKLTNFDLDLTDGDLSFVTDLDAVRQDIEMALRTWLEETPYDLSAGVPYLQVIFVKGTNANSINFILRQIILDRENVTEILSLDSSVNRGLREITITGSVRAFDAEVRFEVSAARTIGPFVPSTLELRSWFDLSRRKFTTDSFGIVSISDEGSLGGTFAQSTDAKKPQLTQSLGTLLRENATPDGSDDFLQHTIAAASWQYLSDATSATIAVVTTDPADADGTLFATMDGAASTDIGIRLRRLAGSLELRIGNGGGAFALDISTAVIADTAKIIVIRLDATGVETQINGAVVAGLTAAYAVAPVASAPDEALTLFSQAPVAPLGGGLWAPGWWYASARRITDVEVAEFFTELNARYGIF